MNKPNGYDNVSIGDFTPIIPGGHHMIIKGVEELTSSTGKAMLKVAFDFDQNDQQPGYMAKLFKDDIRHEKKWPNSGVTYVVAVDANGNTSRNFKSFIKSVEDSNKGFITSWCDGAAFTNQFKGKKVGGVFGKIEDEYNGKRSIKTKLRWFCSTDRVAGAKVPDPKLLEVKQTAPAHSDPTAGMIPVNDEDIPF